MANLTNVSVSHSNDTITGTPAPTPASNDINLLFIGITCTLLLAFTCFVVRSWRKEEKRPKRKRTFTGPPPFIASPRAQHVQQESNESNPDRAQLPASKHQTDQDAVELKVHAGFSEEVAEPAATASPPPDQAQSVVAEPPSLVANDAKMSDADSPNGICARLKKSCSFTRFYVITIFLFTLLLLFCKQLNIGGIDDLLDKGQAYVVDWFDTHHWIHIVLVILVILAAKGAGIKDPLSLRTMAVVILAHKVFPNSQTLQIALAGLIMALQSSIAKLIEYLLIADELQFVIGKVVHVLISLLRKLLGRCCPEHRLKWLDLKWIQEISIDAKEDRNFHILNNFEFSAWLNVDCCVKRENRCKNWLLRALESTLSVAWMSMIEWVSPFSDFFLYAHNWKFSPRSVVLIVLSEIADIDRMMELRFFVKEYPNLIDGKFSSAVSKPVYWSIGYFLVLPFTLYWAYKYHLKNAPREHEVDRVAPDADEQAREPSQEREANLKDAEAPSLAATHGGSRRGTATCVEEVEMQMQRQQSMVAQYGSPNVYKSTL